jgi:hypothetical protein
MNTTVTFSENSCAIICEPKLVLTELSLALEFMANSFIGRGVYRWSVDRLKGDNGECIVTGKALSPSGVTKVSQVMRLMDAVEAGLLPRHLNPIDFFEMPNSASQLAKDGQNRRLIGKANPDGWTESIIEATDISPQGQLAIFSYGFADMAVGLFALGVRHLKYQFSLTKSQIYIKHMLDDKRLIEFFRSVGNDYKIDSSVENLP